MLLETLCQPWSKFCATSLTDSSFPSTVATVTKPSGNGVLDFSGGAVSQNIVRVMPYGIGSNNDTFDLRLWGWSVVKGDQANVRDLWVPDLIFQVACTLSARTGVVGSAVLNTELFVDTITLTYGSTSDVVINSPANDLPANIRADFYGFSLLQLTGDLGAGTNMNALFRLL